MTRMTSSPTQHSGRRISAERGVVDPTKVVPARRERRGRSRVLCEGLSCTLGRVVGLSATGMRVRARGWCRLKQDDRVSMTLTHTGGQLTVRVRIAWVRKTGLFQYEAGMAFEGLSPEQSSELAHIAQVAMPKMMMRRGPLPDLPTE